MPLHQAKDGRHAHTGRDVEGARRHSRQGVNENAPRITVLQIPKDKIREVIGSPVARVIREIVEVTGAKVDIDDDGTVKVSSTDAEFGAKSAIDWIKGIVVRTGNGRGLCRAR